MKIVLYTTFGRPAQAMPALIDSGADRSMIPHRWHGPLGVDLTGVEGEPNSQGKSFTSPVPLLARMGDTMIPLQPDFLLRGDDRELLILGRRDFFAAYVVTFDEPTRTVELTPSTAPLPAHMRPFDVPV